MAQATLTFSIPEEEAEFRDALDSGNLRGVLEEVGRALRSRLKHGHDDRKVTCPKEAYQEIRDLLYEALQQHDLVLFK